MQRVRVKLGEISWPRHCAACLEFPQNSVKTSCTIITKTMPFFGFIPIAWHHTSIRYPVCFRHSHFARLIAFLTKRNPVNLGVLTVVSGWFFVSILFFIALSLGDGSNNDAEFFLISSGIPLVMILMYLWARLRVPVRIDDVDEVFLTLTIGNSDFATLLKQANQDSVN
ncbi:MAG: hypothetical protein IH838_01530 [Proteobacteria bacterium]|nr:hypothetical protein [Pseudomonadota bacterium]